MGSRKVRSTGGNVGGVSADEGDGTNPGLVTKAVEQASSLCRDKTGKMPVLLRVGSI